jgi:site-specific recombinase XerC
VATWAETFLSLARRLSLKTQETYRRDLMLYIVPRFGSYRLGWLPAEEIEEWLNDEIDEGVAPSSVHRHYRTLRTMLQVAVQKRKILANPCDGVKPPHVPKREMVFLDWDQVVALAEAHQPRFRGLDLHGGGHRDAVERAHGLLRSKVDLRGPRIRVTESLVQLKDNSFVRKEPKTSASVRSISISAATAAMLAAHMREFCSPESDALVFPNGAGKPISSSSFRGYHFGKALRATGVSCRFHDLRHTSAALAIATAPIQRPSRPEWVTRRSPSLSTATGTNFLSSTRRSPWPSTNSSERP